MNGCAFCLRSASRELFFMLFILYNLSLRCEHPTKRVGGMPDTLLGFSNAS